MVSTQELRYKEVINIDDGKTMGFVEDIVLNLELGTVEGLVIPRQNRGFLSFFNGSSEITIPWSCVRRVGDEVILVEMSRENELAFGGKDR